MKLETGNRLQNRLVLAPRHQLFLSILNLPYPGLEGFVRKEAEENPFLEYDPGRIREITAGEKSPLSDREIAARLSGQGIMVSVRTVNKYRHREGIMNSYLRRK